MLDQKKNSQTPMVPAPSLVLPECEQERHPTFFSVFCRLHDVCSIAHKPLQLIDAKVLT